MAIARAVAGGRRLLFAGEPSGVLDLASGDAVMRMLPGACTRGAGAVAVTRDAELAWRADRVVSIRDGRVTGHQLQERTRSHG